MLARCNRLASHPGEIISKTVNSFTAQEEARENFRVRKMYSEIDTMQVAREREKSLKYFSFCLVHTETKFTKKPENTLLVDLGSNATFQWECNFGNEEDWTNFEQVFWGGETDKYGNIGNKFLTIDNSEKVWTNPKLPDSVRSRAMWSGTVSRKSCQLVFRLRNAIVSDDGTYGCIGVVYGETFKSSPVRLVVLGRCLQDISSRKLIIANIFSPGSREYHYGSKVPGPLETESNLTNKFVRV